MGYLAAETERVIIASGILPIYTTPSLLAMTGPVSIICRMGELARLGARSSGY